LGSLTLEAVTNLNLYLVMASLRMGATMLIVGNLWADLLLKAIDPRIKLEDLR
jgi:peptide/nickel transport system permease protein